MNYSDYYKAWQRAQLEITALRSQLQDQHWTSYRNLDDALALLLEEIHPDHEYFEWQPLDEHTVQVQLRFPTEEGWLVKVLTLPVSELLPPSV